MSKATYENINVQDFKARSKSPRHLDPNIIVEDFSAVPGTSDTLNVQNSIRSRSRSPRNPDAKIEDFSKVQVTFENLTVQDSFTSRSKSPRNPDPDAKFEDLPELIKTKILNTTIVFQGVEITLNDVTKQDLFILNLLTPKEIQTILSEDRKLIIGQICRNSSKFKFMERKFIESKFDGDEDNIKTFLQVQVELESSRRLILADAAGTGRTVIIENIFKRLKVVYPTYWIGYIRLKKHNEIMQEYCKLLRDPTIEEIRNLLIDILKIKSELEIELFTKLLFTNRVILFFDEIDEVDAKFFQFALKIVYVLKMSSENQLWISCRPIYGKRLGEILNCPVYKLVPLTWEQKKVYINEVLNKMRIVNDNFRAKIIEDFEKILRNSENRDDCCKIFDSLFLLEAVVELYIDDKVFFWSESFTLYGTFEKFINSQIKKVDAISKSQICDSNENFTLTNVHQVFALKLLIGDSYDKLYRIGLDELSILKQWEAEKYKWTFEKIHRYGLLTINLDDPKGKINSMDFARRTYAEFFIAEFIVTFMFRRNPNIEYEVEENEKFLKIFKLVLAEVQDFEMTRCFIFSFVFDNLNSRKVPLHDEMRTEILKNIFKIHNEILNFVYGNGSLILLENWSIFLKNEPELLKLLWHVGKKRNCLVKLLFKDDRKRRLDFKELLDVISKVFGPNWHKIFNKSRMPIINDSDIGNIEAYECQKFKGFNRNLVKFLDVVDKNFEKEEKQLVYKEYISSFKIVPMVKEEVFKLILKKGYEIFDNTEGLAEIIIKFLKHSSNLYVLICAGQSVEALLNNDMKTIRRILFGLFQYTFHPLVVSLKSKNVATFRIYRRLYTKYKNTWKEIQDILVNTKDIIPEIIENMTNELYEEFQEFMGEIFHTDQERLQDVLLNYSNNDKKSFSFESKNQFEKFVNFVFLGHQGKIECAMSNFFKRKSEGEIYENSSFKNIYDTI
ncbi:unnamed protein product [Chironomus riparius]|uniref:NACHT domain-containing protein n=1 Tax=Chironomus riparius TaxID=315576 RepID=A0A9N9WLQ9_9DIPT|nr:unnamed protein product [Chironomus riparius]